VRYDNHAHEKGQDKECETYLGLGEEDSPLSSLRRRLHDMLVVRTESVRAGQVE
jgi:hypothetical protein